MATHPCISLVIPVFNEGDGICRFLDTLDKHLDTLSNYTFEYIIINDGSDDHSDDALTNYTFSRSSKVIHFSRNFGKESAVTAGLAHASGDAVLIIDADFQHPFSVMDELIHTCFTDDFDMVYAVRNNRKDEGLLKRALTHCFYKLVNMGRGPKLPIDAGDFRIMSRKVVDALLSCTERVRFMKGLYAWVGFKTKAIEFAVCERQHGKSKWNIAQLIRYAIRGIVGFTDIPLKIWTIIGFFISFASFLYGAYNIVMALTHKIDVPGYATLVTAIFFFGGIQLLSIGIIGEYLSRVFQEVKGRPTYLIRDIHESHKND